MSNRKFLTDHKYLTSLNIGKRKRKLGTIGNEKHGRTQKIIINKSCSNKLNDK